MTFLLLLLLDVCLACPWGVQRSRSGGALKISNSASHPTPHAPSSCTTLQTSSAHKPVAQAPLLLRLLSYSQHDSASKLLSRPFPILPPISSRSPSTAIYRIDQLGTQRNDSFGAAKSVRDVCCLPRYPYRASHRGVTRGCKLIRHEGAT